MKYGPEAVLDALDLTASDPRVVVADTRVRDSAVDSVVVLRR